MTERRIIATGDAPSAIGPYSQAVVAALARQGHGS